MAYAVQKNEKRKLEKLMAMPEEEREQAKQPEKKQKVSNMEVKMRMQSAKTEQEKKTRPEYNHYLEIYTAYAKNQQLGPKIRDALGDKYFSKTPTDLAGLKEKVEQIRGVFAKGKAPKVATAVLIGGAKVTEKYWPQIRETFGMSEQLDMTGFGDLMYGIMSDPENEQVKDALAEVDCEHPKFLSGGCYARVMEVFSDTALLVAKANYIRAQAGMAKRGVKHPQ